MWSTDLSSELVAEAVAATRWRFGPHPPDQGMVTFVDRDQTRRKRDPGRCFRRAGFVEDGETEGGLVALVLSTANMRYLPPIPPVGAQFVLGLAPYGSAK